MDNYDIIIVGGGPAGLTAGLYAARARLNTLLIERGLFGGQIANAEHVENFPGFPQGISGYDLGQLLMEQASKYGLQAVTAEAEGIEAADTLKTVKTGEGNFSTKALILAGGSKRQELGVPGEKEFTGKGVSYCATCDAAFFKDQPVAVVGGGNAAITEALHLTKFATKVIVIHRRHELRATRIMQERAFADPKIEFKWDTTVEAVEGDQLVKRLKLKNVSTGEKSTLDINGVFVSIGFQPDTDYLKGIISLDPFGHVITNGKMETSVSGIYAAGDIRHDSARQAVTAAGDGATAAIYAERAITEGK